MALQAVVFDMDGVLTDTVEYHYLSWRKVCQEFDLPFSRQDNDLLLGLNRRKSLETIMGARHLTEEQIQAILQRKNQYFLDMISEMDAASLLPGVPPLLDDLRAAGLRLAVASASRNARTILEQLGIRQYFAVVMDGTAPLRSKPAPDVYLKAAAALGVKPELCLAVEDSPAGIRAALAAGMCVVGLGQPQLVGSAHAVLHSLIKVRAADLCAIHRWWHAAHFITKLESSDNSLMPKSSWQAE